MKKSKKQKDIDKELVDIIVGFVKDFKEGYMNEEEFIVALSTNIHLFIENKAFDMMNEIVPKFKKWLKKDVSVSDIKDDVTKIILKYFGDLE